MEDRKWINGVKCRRLEQGEFIKEGDLVEYRDGSWAGTCDAGRQAPGLASELVYWRPMKGERTTARKHADLIKECQTFFTDELSGLSIDNAEDASICAALLARWIEGRQ